MKTPELSFLNEQLSIPAAELIHPAPDDQQLQAILQAAMSAPDHGSLKPYRFLIVQGEARHALSQVFEQAAINRKLEPEAINKQKNKPLRSPLIIIVIAKISNNPKIPEIEQILSAGCAAQHIQLASRSMGFGSIWLTGDNCYDTTVYEALGLDIDERVVGFIYLGTPQHKSTRKIRPQAIDITQNWQGPAQSEYAI